MAEGTDVRETNNSKFDTTFVVDD